MGPLTLKGDHVITNNRAQVVEKDVKGNSETVLVDKLPGDLLVTVAVPSGAGFDVLGYACAEGMCKSDNESAPLRWLHVENKTAVVVAKEIPHGSEIVSARSAKVYAEGSRLMRQRSGGDFEEIARSRGRSMVAASAGDGRSVVFTGTTFEIRAP